MLSWDTIRREAVRTVIDGFFRGLATTAKWAPMARPEAHGVEVIPNLSYGDSGEANHLLDIYRPADASRHGRLPVVLYIHGGGFRILSKDTHWIMGLLFARRGYLLFNINYRLAPMHPFPAGLQDACRAYAWVTENAHRYGGSLDEGWIVAGESAGANLATTLTLCSCHQRREPWAEKVFNTGLVPHAVMAACGILQTTDPGRFARRRRIPRWVMDRLEEVSNSYLAGLEPPRGAAQNKELELADPLVLLEQGLDLRHPLPPFYAPVGTWDPLLDDTRRLKSALDSLKVPCLARYFPREVHAFMAFIWRRQARECWREAFDFFNWVKRGRKEGRRRSSGPDASQNGAERDLKAPRIHRDTLFSKT